MSWSVIVGLTVFAYLTIGFIVAIIFVATKGVKIKEEITYPLFGWPVLLAVVPCALAVVIGVSIKALYNKFLGVIWWLGGGEQQPQQQNQAPQ